MIDLSQYYITTTPTSLLLLYCGSMRILSNQDRAKRGFLFLHLISKLMQNLLHVMRLLEA